jgi:hypothetical protein
MARKDKQSTSPLAQDIADDLMLPTAELGAPLIAGVFLVIALAVHFGFMSPTRHFKATANSAHLHAALRSRHDDLRQAADMPQPRRLAAALLPTQKLGTERPGTERPGTD